MKIVIYRKDKLAKLLHEYEVLFNGELGQFNCDPVNLELTIGITNTVSWITDKNREKQNSSEKKIILEERDSAYVPVYVGIYEQHT